MNFAPSIAVATYAVDAPLEPNFQMILVSIMSTDHRSVLFEPFCGSLVCSSQKTHRSFNSFCSFVSYVRSMREIWSTNFAHQFLCGNEDRPFVESKLWRSQQLFIRLLVGTWKYILPELWSFSLRSDFGADAEASSGLHRALVFAVLSGCNPKQRHFQTCWS